MGKEGFHSFSIPSSTHMQLKDSPFPLPTASWVGLFAAQQYSAAKHGVLGLMRSLDPFAESDNIRTACIHPWFTGKLFPLFPHLNY
jgi:NAD(P)-dependent dehydrogenase (short-subunit alcohol dehydrogenase family)